MRTLVVASAMVLLASACATSSEETGKTKVTYGGLVEALRDSGLNLAEVGKVKPMPCFIAPPKAAVVGGGTLEVYEYGDAESADTAASQISPAYFEARPAAEQNLPSTTFYRRKTILVKYLGSDAQVTAVLESALGTPFAGDSSAVRC